MTLIAPPPKKRHIQMTLFVDASFCPKTKAAGWAAWAKSDLYDRGYYFGDLVTIGEPQTSSQAELMGIAHACRVLADHNEFEKLDSVVLQCDSLDALQVIWKNVPSANVARKKDSGRDIKWLHYLKIAPNVATSVLLIQGVFKTIPVWLRHVKGHEKGVTGRSHVNETCDKIAKRHMNEERQRRYALECRS